jgi:FMN reductase
MDQPSERAALISGSPSEKSRSGALLARARERLDTSGFETTVIELASLPAEALLGRKPDGRVEEALRAVQSAGIVVAASPVYKATYSGLLKVFFDLLPKDALVGKVGVPILTGSSPAHSLALDHGFRPLFASLGAAVVANAAYGWDAQFTPEPVAALLALVDRAIEEAVAMARAAQVAGAQTMYGR